MRTLYSLAFWIFMAVSSAFMFAFALVLFAITYPFDRNRRALHLFTCFWAMLYFYVNPLWRVRVQNRDRLPWKGRAVLVANHQSLGDILVLFALYRPFKWVSKASVFRVPFIGWNMTLNGYVPLVRGDKRSAVDMFAACASWLDREMPILMFPEGTRSPDGTLLPFKDGAFRLAIDKGCPVVPIVLTGTARTLPKHGFVLDSRADCVVRVLPAISPAPFGGDVAALREHVRDVMLAEVERLGSAPASAEPVETHAAA